MLLVCETFASIQGESTHAGRRCFFIRLSGCSHRCSYCDTAYAWTGGEALSVETLVERAKRTGIPLVEVTGGEPMEQRETPRLSRELLNAGFEVLLETNGAHDLGEIPQGVRRIIDCKTPSSGMAERHDFGNFERLRDTDEIKFVVGSRGDFDYAVKVVSDYDLANKKCELLISPVCGKVNLADLAAWVLASGLPLRMQLQMHKIVWGDRRGV